MKLSFNIGALILRLANKEMHYEHSLKNKLVV